MTEERNLMPHQLTLNERSRLSVTGVSDVVRFDEEPLSSIPADLLAGKDSMAISVVGTDRFLYARILERAQR